MEEQTQLTDPQVLEEYYAHLPREYGYYSQCKMTLIGDLKGKRVVDIDCRRGKGVIKLSDYVGQRGFAVGVDPSQEWVDVGLSFMDDAWRRNGLIRNNMDYRRGYAENLEVAGLKDGEFDMVFANSSVNLAYRPDIAFKEFYRVLRPGGVLMFDSVVAEGPRDAAVVEQARAIGNSIQSALPRAAVDEYARAAGFYAPEYYEEFEVGPDVGVTDDTVVPIVETDEDARFIKTTARIFKPRA